MKAGTSGDAANALGDYLRARRALVAPEQLGFPVTRRRRVSGLTRDELATRAGISVEYYVRLEQGRDRHPSPQVLTALASTLGLDATAAAFLLDLGRDRSAVEPPAADEAVPQGILDLLRVWTGTPAFVLGRFGAVLAASPAVTDLTPACRPGVNMFREIFLDPDSRKRYVNWFDFTAVLVGSLRAAAGRDVESPELVRLVAELEANSERFRDLWSRHDTAPRSGGRTLIEHPRVGRIELLVETLAIRGGDLTIVIYHARPGSLDEAAVLRVAAGAA